MPHNNFVITKFCKIRSMVGVDIFFKAEVVRLLNCDRAILRNVQFSPSIPHQFTPKQKFSQTFCEINKINCDLSTISVKFPII